MPRVIPHCFVFVCVGSTLLLPSVAYADQFYANSNGEYAWDIDTKKKQRTTTLFVKHPSDRVTYRQVTAVIYDRDLHHVVYLDVPEKRVVGRFDLVTEKFSLLPPDAQKVRQAIDKYDFPPAASMPRIEELFSPLSDANHSNRERLQLPPPTAGHPRLEHSTWESSYMSADRFTIRCTVHLDGDQGTYQLRDKPGTGRLSDVEYESAAEDHIIRGQWNLGQSSGNFQFKVPAENLNVFWGEFGFQPGKTVGSWTGVRRPSASKATRKPVR